MYAIRSYYGFDPFAIATLVDPGVPQSRQSLAHVDLLLRIALGACGGLHQHRGILLEQRGLLGATDQAGREVDSTQRYLDIGTGAFQVATIRVGETLPRQGGEVVLGFLACKEEFEAVPATSPNYERARVYVGRCLMSAGRDRNNFV